MSEPEQAASVSYESPDEIHRFAAQAATVPREEWFITDNFFHNGGRVYNGWGPFATQELALRVRELLEGLPTNQRAERTFFVDSRPTQGESRA